MVYSDDLRMYNGSNTALALSNEFGNNVIQLKHKVSNQCANQDDLCYFANLYSHKKTKWSVEYDTGAKTCLVSTDPLGNCHYLIVAKIEQENPNTYTDEQLIMELLNRGYTVTKSR